MNVTVDVESAGVKERGKLSEDTVSSLPSDEAIVDLGVEVKRKEGECGRANK